MLKCQVDYAALQGLRVDDHRTFGSGSAFGGAEATCYQTGCHKVREPSTSRLCMLVVWQFGVFGCCELFFRTDGMWCYVDVFSSSDLNSNFWVPSGYLT